MGAMNKEKSIGPRIDNCAKPVVHKVAGDVEQPMRTIFLLLSPFFIGWISETATDSRKIQMDLQSGRRWTIQVYLF